MSKLKLFLYENRIDENTKPTSLNINFESKNYIKSKELDNTILKKLPYFYPILFTGKDNSTSKDKILPKKLKVLLTLICLFRFSVGFILLTTDKDAPFLKTSFKNKCPFLFGCLKSF